LSYVQSKTAHYAKYFFNRQTRKLTKYWYFCIIPYKQENVSWEMTGVGFADVRPSIGIVTAAEQRKIRSAVNGKYMEIPDFLKRKVKSKRSEAVLVTGSGGL
jgi:hypothetical protein